MKKTLTAVVLAVALVTLLAGTALAAGPATPPGPGNGIHAPGTGRMQSGMMGRGAPAWAGQPEEVATLLGMTAQEIQAERQAGKSLAQIAASKNVSTDTLVNTILEAKKADLSALVAEGTITQAQMDLMVGHMQTQIKTMVERTGVGPANQGQARPRMGQGMRMGRGGQR